MNVIDLDNLEEGQGVEHLVAPVGQEDSFEQPEVVDLDVGMEVPEEPVIEQGPTTEAEWIQNADFLALADTLSEPLGLNKNTGAKHYLDNTKHQNKSLVEKMLTFDQTQAAMAEANENYIPTDEEKGVALFEAVGQLLTNVTKGGFTAAEVSEWSEDQQEALAKAIGIYQSTDFEAATHVPRALRNLLTDPTSYVAVTTLLQGLSKVALKPAAAKTVQELLTKKAAVVGGVSAVEGGLYAAGANVSEQLMTNGGDLSKVDKGEVAVNTGIGMAIAGPLGYFGTRLFNRSDKSRLVEDTGEAKVYRLEEPEEPTIVDEIVENLEEAGTVPKDRSDVELDAPKKTDEVDVEAEAATKADEVEALKKTDTEETWEWNHINTDRIESVDDIKKVLDGQAEKIKTTSSKFTGANETESLEESYEMARMAIDDLNEQTGMDMQEILNQYANDVEELQQIRYRATGLRELNVKLAERVDELAEKQSQAGLSVEEAAEFLEKVALFDQVMELVALGSREASRGLGNYRLIVKGDDTLMHKLRDGTATGDVKAIADTINAMKTTRKGTSKAKLLKEATNEMKDGTLLDEVIRFRSAMMLSGPSTIESAAISNFLKLLTEPFVEWVGHIGAGEANRIGRKRAMAQYVGTKKYFIQSWKQAAKAYRNGQHITDPFVTKIEGQQDKSLQNMSGLRRNLWERGVHQAHLLLLLLDEGIKANRARALNWANTVVDAEKKDIEVGTDAFTDLLEKHTKRNFDKTGRVRNAEILREVREATYTSELEGDIGKLITDAANFGGGLGRLFVVPFIRAPINILSEGLMYFPGSSVISAKQKNIMKNGSEIAQKKLQARKVMGTAFIGGAWYLAEEDIITGAGPSDYKMNKLWKEAGYEPYSIRVGDEWISYRKLEPIATILGIVADANYISKMDTSGTNAEDALIKILGGAMHAVTENILNKAYFSSIQQFMTALEDADGFEKYIKSWVGSFTPNLLSQVNNDPHLREAVSLGEQIQRRIPELSEKLGAQYDIYGRPIVKPAHDIPFLGFMFKNREVVNDPVAQKIFELSEDAGRAIVQKPMYSIGVAKQDFREVFDYGESESVYAKYNRYIGELRDESTGMTLHETLAEVIGSEDFNDLPVSSYEDITSPQVKAIQAYVNMYRQMAKARLYEESPAYRDALTSRTERLEGMWDN